ncbi:MAG: transporter substrate-binding domain-containing protein [Oscillospiraceae bacterium]|jgi:polar amino acid transport system substrate-binding protein|nr:transporter substrate-binding domain-containing protein [Oscillospiraceae bacterium]
MKKRTIIKKFTSIIAILIALASILALAACGEKVPATDPTATPSGGVGADPATAAPPITVTKIIIGNSGGPKPYSYQEDGSENYVGYDRDVIAAIDELLPEYEFEFQVTEFPAIFTGINAGLYQMGVNNITKKPEREAQWLFGQEPYSFNGQVIVTRLDDTSINSIEDLGGKKLYVPGTGLYTDIFADSYNKAHPDNPIITVTSGIDGAVGYEDLINGVVDFAFGEYWGLKIRKQSYPEQFEVLRILSLSDEEARQIEDPLAWYIYPKTEDGQDLADAVDEAIAELRTSGKIRELAVKWFGEDGLPEWFNG